MQFFDLLQHFHARNIRHNQVGNQHVYGVAEARSMAFLPFSAVRTV